jgi:bacillithiol biosynthesis cysteine-adding enzyme BshC
MNSTASTLSFSATGFFSKLVADYIAADKKLQPFYEHAVDLDGIKNAMQQRKQFNTNRPLLVDNFTEKYSNIPLTEKQQANINRLANENTFTITTAHQPNIFTGHLYFIYKILHAIKLADYLCEQLPEANFVPVYYMGSEDADLDELGFIVINGEQYKWNTNQTGAVGRMKVDKALVQLIDQFSGQLLVHPFGASIVDVMRKCYTIGTTIEQATFALVNELFAAYGLLILLPDDTQLKDAFSPIIAAELNSQFSHEAVAKTVNQFPAEYKVQTSGRELNLFYLQEQSRERIEKVGDHFEIVNTDLQFTVQEMMKELKNHPERFSPNVILRPVFQEFILPNIAFIGGGGEIAYWLELKRVFAAVKVPYPMLIVRNSFLVIEKKYQQILDKLQLSHAAIFSKEFDLMNALVKRDSDMQVELTNEKEQLQNLYQHISEVAGKIDATLHAHTAALFVKTNKKILALEKKMLRAEKKKFETQQQQLHKIKSQLFPNNSLQERVENFMGLYAQYGDGFIQALYENSLTLEQQFTVLVQH